MSVTWYEGGSQTREFTSQKQTPTKHRISAVVRIGSAVVRTAPFLFVPPLKLKLSCSFRRDFTPAAESIFIPAVLFPRHKLKHHLAAFADPFENGHERRAAIDMPEFRKQPAVQKRLARQSNGAERHRFLRPDLPRADGKRKRRPTIALENPADDNHVAITWRAGETHGSFAAILWVDGRRIKLEGD